jgi:hypothetical protein
LSEHAIEALKNCFRSLKGLCFQISSKKRHHFIILWITWCVNLVIHIEKAANSLNLYEWYTPKVHGREDEIKEDGNKNQPVSERELFCQKVMRDILDIIE